MTLVILQRALPTTPSLTALDMGNNQILNIGAAGTDFASNGGLTLANALTVTTGGATITGASRITGGTLDLGTAGSSLGVLEFNGNTSGTITVQSAAAAGTWTLTLPPDDGDAGEQLQTDGSGVATWEAAASYREVKNLVGLLDPQLALERIRSAPIHLFRYKRDATHVGGDYETLFAGVVADEAPWAMKHGGRIFNEISAVGHAFAAIQALESRVRVLES